MVDHSSITAIGDGQRLRIGRAHRLEEKT